MVFQMSILLAAVFLSSQCFGVHRECGPLDDCTALEGCRNCETSVCVPAPLVDFCSECRGGCSRGQVCEDNQCVDEPEGDDDDDDGDDDDDDDGDDGQEETITPTSAPDAVEEIDVSSMLWDTSSSTITNGTTQQLDSGSVTARVYAFGDYKLRTFDGGGGRSGSPWGNDGSAVCISSPLELEGDFSSSTKDCRLERTGSTFLNHYQAIVVKWDGFVGLVGDVHLHGLQRLPNDDDFEVISIVGLASGMFKTPSYQVGTCLTVRNYTLLSSAFPALGLREDRDLQVRGARVLEYHGLAGDPCDRCYQGTDECLAVASFADDLDGLVYLLSVQKRDVDLESSSVAVGVTSLIRVLSNDNDEVGNDDPVCFPADATLELMDVSSVTMKNLKLGDMIRSDDRSFVEVYLFSHQSEYVEAVFVEISCGQYSLIVSPGHYIVSGSGLQLVGRMVPGDTIFHVTGGSMTVPAVSKVKRTGLYAGRPEYYVNGVRVSEFTTAVHPKVARLLLMPEKLAYILVYRSGMSNICRAVAIAWGCASKILQRKALAGAKSMDTPSSAAGHVALG